MNLTLQHISTLLCSGLCLLACATRPYLPQPAERLVSGSDFFASQNTGLYQAVTMDTRIRPGFLIRLQNEADEKLNGQFRVGWDGSLKLPYSVRVQASGLSLNELRLQLIEKYRTYFKHAPEFKVSLIEQKYMVQVRGLVQKPDEYLIDHKTTVDALIARAGGFFTPNEARVVQVDEADGMVSALDLQQYYQVGGSASYPRWRGGEVIWFLKSSAAAGTANDTLEILGQVQNPGSKVFRRGDDLFAYLARAGGPGPSADLDRIQVARMTADGRKVVSGRAEEIASHLVLEPGDVIIVGSGQSSRWDRGVQLTSALASILSAIGILILAL